MGGRCRGGAHGRRRRIRGAGEARALDDVGAGEDRGLQRAISACVIVVDPAELELQCQRKGGADTEPTLYPARPGAQRARRLVRRLLTVIVSATWPALGTTAAVLVTEPGAIAKARALLKDELEQIDAACSRFRSDSELSRLNAGAGELFAVSDLFAEAVEASIRVARATDGAVDPTLGRAMSDIGYDRDFAELRDDHVVPGTARPAAGWQCVRLDRRARKLSIPAGVELDLGATAKALAADRAARRIHESAGCGVLVSLGGDIAVAGSPPSGGWRIRVGDDHARASDSGQTVSIEDGGLATSSTTVRRWPLGGRIQHHIVDPRTGTSAAEVWRTVSVAARSCVDANAASTASIVRGHRAPGWLRLLTLPSRLVGIDGEVLRVAAWPEASGA